MTGNLFANTTRKLAALIMLPHSHSPPDAPVWDKGRVRSNRYSLSERYRLALSVTRPQGQQGKL